MSCAELDNAARREGKHAVHWFRKGLRLHDNPSLREGLQGATTFRCVFVLDPWFAGSSNVGINKWRFLLQCLEDLDRSLRKLNSRLFVIRGQPADTLPKLFREWGTTALTFEEDPEPFGRVRDHNITALCKELGITVVQNVSHTLYQLQNIIDRNGGKAPLTYHQFLAVIACMGPPPQPEPPVTGSTVELAHTPLAEDHDEKFGVPTLEELGFDTEGLNPPVWQGGETEALARLERHLERKAWVASFGRPKMTPQSLLPSQTGLSPYLRFGCLSTRLFYYQLTDLYKKIKKAFPPLSLHGQLLWREFFYCAATKNPNFDKMLGNPICVQIPWDRNAEALAKWANVSIRSNGLSLDRRHNDPAETRGLDPSFGQTCCGLFFNQGRPLDFVGGRNEGLRGTSPGCRLVSERGHVDVALLFQFFPAVFPLLLSGEVWKESGS
ncbi:cryptochrome-1-like isoform X2 [Anthonomus grandis grandis]|uniref:cryptochrome-1-like isoform X2 n=1 Tax=Anthonomus grandis grandis TaxID=2921223 RepID=UPI0021654A16|nr:cryptochrome-1-like isoform X2 [Anthonomus grandis grandis]